jgi:hypothetical protein
VIGYGDISTAICNVHLSSDQALSVWHSTGHGCRHWVQGKGNYCTCSDELQHMKQNIKLYTTLSAQGAPKCVLKANHLKIGGSEGCVHGVWLFRGMRALV